MWVEVFRFTQEPECLTLCILPICPFCASYLRCDSINVSTVKSPVTEHVYGRGNIVNTFLSFFPQNHLSFLNVLFEGFPGKK